MIIYKLNRGDSLYKISKEYNVPLNKLIEANGFIDQDNLPVGASVVVPTNTNEYKVNKGDSLYSIALLNGTTVDEILKYNTNLVKPYIIYPDQTIILPPKSKTDSVIVNGYCYPNITDEDLQKVLKDLTYICIFSYKIKADGSMISTPDSRVIAEAKKQGVVPIMVLTNLNTEDSFDSALTKKFLRNDVAVDNFVKGLPQFLKDKGYGGINVDFEYVYEENKDDYTLFLQKLNRELKKYNLILSTALAPKVSDNQKGILYEGHDYKAIGEVCDFIMLMTYDWGYVAGPPMAVSPLPEIESVLKYATRIIPQSKLLLGMPNYAYDWTLPYSPGTRAKYLNLANAVKLAADTKSVIEYSLSSATPFFTYRDNLGKEHIVWFDDAKSTKEKLLLTDKYNLGGVGIWTVNKYFAPFWQVLNSLYTVKKV